MPHIHFENLEAKKIKIVFLGRIIYYQKGIDIILDFFLKF